MPNTLKSSSSEPDASTAGAATPGTAPQGWLRVGAIAAASAVVGGLAAAWFYRKTLSRLQDAGNDFPDSLPNLTENETEEDF
ncbi:hypothetical protein [Occallatibacter savannae]|uniref:hypothetical protein n=1 Tax=Occallatibacter savannae TaxID=1002691 RepID=UPI000D697B13|nr:hypothetical protein [Occallatibacter savannae]